MTFTPMGDVREFGFSEYTGVLLVDQALPEYTVCILA